LGFFFYMNELYNDKVTETQGDREKARRERQESDVRWFLSKPEGRRIIWWVLSICGCFKNTTIFQEGRRSVGLEILNLILRAKPSAFNEMQQEFASEAKSDEAMDKILAKQSDRS
jgi:hypothetical protein